MSAHVQPGLSWLHDVLKGSTDPSVKSSYPVAGGSLLPTSTPSPMLSSKWFAVPLYYDNLEVICHEHTQSNVYIRSPWDAQGIVTCLFCCKTRH